MIVNLIKPERMFSLTLPGKVKGQYWIKDVDSEGNPRRLISIEAVDGEWVVKSNKTAVVLNADKQPVVSMPINQGISFICRLMVYRITCFCMQKLWMRADRHSGR